VFKKNIIPYKWIKKYCPFIFNTFNGCSFFSLSPAMGAGTFIEKVQYGYCENNDL
jgi:hypothetical protein